MSCKYFTAFYSAVLFFPIHYREVILKDIYIKPGYILCGIIYIKKGKSKGIYLFVVCSVALSLIIIAGGGVVSFLFLIKKKKKEETYVEEGMEFKSHSLPIS